ncbi:MAG: biotin--[acetyl-CoA-carboxylase] ligase, partial [Bacillota bacterium]|nr:biotin--[acetyl-CoA-carboxylase] ligase [Bacillota bacterium]
SFKGKAIDIDNNGNLIVLSNNKQIILNSGEITIR